MLFGARLLLHARWMIVIYNNRMCTCHLAREKWEGEGVGKKESGLKGGGTIGYRLLTSNESDIRRY